MTASHPQSTLWGLVVRRIGSLAAQKKTCHLPAITNQSNVSVFHILHTVLRPISQSINNAELYTNITFLQTVTPLPASLQSPFCIVPSRPATVLGVSFFSPFPRPFPTTTYPYCGCLLCHCGNLYPFHFLFVVVVVVPLNALGQSACLCSTIESTTAAIQLKVKYSCTRAAGCFAWRFFLGSWLGSSPPLRLWAFSRSLSRYVRKI